ncbi:YczE/YyaS/YitT family protein [Halobacillus campisalis]|uniref:YitT family protein n=1 Tax=Halobacillus campisalis TaxID=435909 RepID=A0ABW2K7S7_9BACI|nr:YitT family protein [Halobacillus campisalis]
MKTFVIKVFFFLVGLVIISLGISLTINADLGVGAWDAMNVGLTNTFGLTVGNWVIIIGAILILTNALIAKEKPDLLAVITIVILGKFIDFWLLNVFADLELTQMLFQIITLVGGIFIIAVGVACYLQPKFSLNPVDNFMVALQKRFGLSLTVSKTLTEGVALLLAIIFGGPIGIGTIIILVCIGPFIQFLDPKAEKVMNRLTSS